MTYYIFIQDGKVNGCGQARMLNDNAIDYEVDETFYNEFSANPEKYIWDGLQVVENPNYEQEQAEKEKERIQELFMTKSDFFDGTIAAWGADKNDLKPIIEATLALLPLDDVTKKKALNNYENAQNFYRKHDLFTLLSNRPLQLSETLQVTITGEQWDKFFDETDKKNPEAYKELPTPEIIPVEEEEPVTEENSEVEE